MPERVSTIIGARIKELEESNSRLLADLSSVERDNLTAMQVRKEIFRLAESNPTPPTWVSEPIVTSPMDPGTPSLSLSDFHWAELVDKENMGGSNEYNLEIAVARLKKVINKVILFKKVLHTPKTTPQGIVVNFLGDMLCGDIHDELIKNAEFTSYPAVLHLTDHLISAIQALKKVFGKVFVIGVVGNHGRNTKKVEFKDAISTNLDWLLYQNIERAFKHMGEKNVFFNFPNDIDAHYILQGHRYCITHGDKMGAKGGDGMIGPLGPISRGRIKMLRDAESIGKPFDTLIVGHWHQDLSVSGLIVNGSLKGYDEYARGKRLGGARPSQTLHYTHPEHGVIHVNPLYLTKARSVDTGGKWLSWEA